jgi:hypothetical protein
MTGAARVAVGPVSGMVASSAAAARKDTASASMTLR